MRSRLKVNKVRFYPREVIYNEDVIPEIARRDSVTLYQCFIIWIYYKNSLELSKDEYIWISRKMAVSRYIKTAP